MAGAGDDLCASFDRLRRARGAPVAALRDMPLLDDDATGRDSGCVVRHYTRYVDRADRDAPAFTYRVRTDVAVDAPRATAWSP